MYVDADGPGGSGPSLVALNQLYGHNYYQSLATSKTLKLNQGALVFIQFNGSTTDCQGGRAFSYFSGHLVK